MEKFIDQLTNPISAVGHLNYILVILSVSMSSMRWLRIFAIASGADRRPLLRLPRLRRDQRDLGVHLHPGQRRAAGDRAAGRAPQAMDEDEKLFVETVMPMLDGNLRARMLKLARWETRDAGDVLVEEDQSTPQLVFIARGAASVEKGGTIVGVCGPGDFLGEMSFLTGKPASATVRVANEVRCCVYDPAALKALAKKHPAIRQALEFCFNRNLVGKLERMNEASRVGAISV